MMPQQPHPYLPPPAPPRPVVPSASTPLPPRSRVGRNRRKVILDIAIPSAILFIASLVAWLIRYDPIRGFDEGILLVYSERILHGAVPNLEFFSVYPPGNFWAIALSYKIFGISIGAERLVGTFYRLLLIAGVYLFALPHGRAIAAACALLAIVTSTFSGLAAFAWTGAVACSIISIALLGFHIRRPQSAKLILPALAGLFAGITAGLRVDTPAVGIVVAAVPLLIAMKGWRPRIAFGGGWLLGILPLIWHALRIGPGQFIENVFIETTRRIGPARHLPLPPSDPATAELLYLTLGCALVLALAAGTRLWHSRRREDWIYVSGSLFLLCALPQALQRTDVDHCMFVAQLTWVFLPLAFSLFFEQWATPVLPGWVRQSICVSLALNILFFVGRGVFPDPKRMVSTRNPAPAIRSDLEPALNKISRPVAFLSNRGRSVPFPNEAEAAVFSAVLQHVESISRPGEGVFVGTGDLRYTGLNDVFLYFLLPQLTPTGYYLEMNPNSANREDSPMARDIARANVLILNAVHSEPGPNRGQRGSDKPNKVVQEQFELSATGGFIGIYLRKR